MQDLHVVLGASGATGGAVVSELKNKGLSIRAVERSKQVDGVETVFANLLDSTCVLVFITVLKHGNKNGQWLWIM